MTREEAVDVGSREGALPATQPPAVQSQATQRQAAQPQQLEKNEVMALVTAPPEAGVSSRRLEQQQEEMGRELHGVRADLQRATARLDSMEESMAAMLQMQQKLLGLYSRPTAQEP